MPGTGHVSLMGPLDERWQLASLSRMVMGIYGPTGVCLPQFSRDAQALQQEAELVQFLHGEVQKAQELDWSLLVMGDHYSSKS